VTITLHQFGPAWSLPDYSPFCVKVETYLRMTRRPFRSAISDVRKAPKHKLPYVQDGDVVISDSRAIVAHFEAEAERPLDGGLSPEDRAASVAFRSLFEEEMYFLLVYLRWIVDENFRVFAPVFHRYVHVGAGIPKVFAPLIARVARKQMRRECWGQGTGRHSREDVEGRLHEIVDVLADQIGVGPYFLGSHPRTIDATAHGFLWSLLDSPNNSTAQSYALSRAPLVAYKERMLDEFFRAPVAGGTAAPVGMPS